MMARIGQIFQERIAKEITWTPKKDGSYLLCFQITTESGKVYQAFNSLEVTKKNNIKVNGIHVDNMNAKGEIKLPAECNNKWCTSHLHI